MSVVVNKKSSWFIKKDRDSDSSTSPSSKHSNRLVGITNYNNVGPQLLLSEIEPPMYQITPIKSHFFNDKKIGNTMTKIKKDSKFYGCIIGGSEIKKQNSEIEKIYLFMYNFGTF